MAGLCSTFDEQSRSAATCIMGVVGLVCYGMV